MRIGIDLGGTKIEGIVLDGDREVARQRVATPRGDYHAILKSILQLIQQLENSAGEQCRVGIGGPGSLNKDGLLRNSNTTELNGKPFLQELEQLAQRDIRYSNDANCFALAEAVVGAAQNFSTVFGVILGTGVGGALIVNRKILVGANAVGGEWGHNPLPWITDSEQQIPRLCYCGKQNCIETFLAGPGLEKSFFQLSEQSIRSEEIVQRASNGDLMAKECLDNHTDQLARSLAIVVNIFDPECIVIGGGLSKLKHLYTEVPKRWQQYIFSDQVVTKLLPPTGGDSAGVIGAAWLWP